jgi:hypothetical protein
MTLGRVLSVLFVPFGKHFPFFSALYKNEFRCKATN